ncbi:unnamed protein product [Caenorhabditis sp. 36 PRJEB53466]|nr:unnamed protein product [Caenorhabditis sp. 36 PRJEB53466]
MGQDGDEIRIIVLEEGEHLESAIRKVEKGWIVRFKRGSSLLGKNVSVTTTLTGSDHLTWSSGTDHLSVYCQVTCHTAGSFRYSFTTDVSEKETGSGYFLVMPELKVNGKPLPLDAITCQTYLVKLLGELPEWKERLRVAKESGYNMIHLTPIHELGISNSSYSISDHHAIIPTVHSKDQKFGFDDVHKLVNEIEKEWDILTVQDVVWNHAAKNANWLLEHPESAYNCQNSPHLRPAYIVDRIYHEFGKQVGEGKWAHRGVPPVVDKNEHLLSIASLLRNEILPKAEIHEFYQVDLTAMVKLFEMVVKQSGGPTDNPLDGEDVQIVQDPEYRRFGNTVDFDRSLRIFNRHRDDVGSEDERVEKVVKEFKDALSKKNLEAGTASWHVLMDGLRAVNGHIRYERVAEDGPKKGLVSPDSPLTTDYFLHLEPDAGWKSEEKLAYDPEKSKYLMAFNGWVMSSNPLNNFALKDSQVYLRRELVCWGDSVKLNYGEREEDSPFLWEFMKEYTQKCARIFHGLRIDNAHGTPIHVAEKLLKAAREIRPDIYVFAELFTGSENADNMFVNRLGISSLIREAQSAHDSHEQGRLVYRYGGDCVGAFQQKSARLAPNSIAHGLFLDQSHDNSCPLHTRSAFDILPTAAMITMASCAVGSNRGYDELVRDHIHVVSEKRPYASWLQPLDVSAAKGIISGRKILNNLHSWLALNGYTQVFVDQMNTDIVGITRHNPTTHETVVVVSHTAFSKHYNQHVGGLKHIPIGGVLEKVLFEMKLNETAKEWGEENQAVIVGLANFSLEIKEDVPIEQGNMFKIHGGVGGFIELTDFPTGSVVGFKIRPSDEARDAFKAIHSSIGSSENGLSSALSRLTYQSFSDLLFHCESEDYATIQQGGYDIPNFGKFVYNGLQGMIPVLDKIRVENDLGHPLCQNLRDGTWLCDYLVSRLAKFEKLKEVSEEVGKLLKPLEHVPYYLRPCYFETIISHIYGRARAEVLSRMSSDVVSSSALFRWLAISTVSFLGYIPGAGLSPIAASIPLEDEHPSSLAAGLSHFAVGIWRNWGRDTFIALPGCLLSLGRFQEAHHIILSFAGALRHGLIPNLLAEGIGARFNCRDATWFWLVSIVKYVSSAPEGEKILGAPVRRIYPTDDAIYGDKEVEQPLIETIYEALDKHFAGIDYRERNAGPQIDEQMRDEGFQVTAGVNKENGFIHGGNRWNCGTWMDKMGSSERAGNKGEPATPRDGAAVELQGLAYRTLSALQEWKEKDAQGEFVNRREIVKDSVGSSLGFTDFQLRCNFGIALAVAPELLDARKAWNALNTAEVLLGPLGIKTLDPTDWGYNGYYNNDDDGTDKKTAKGWNYHQGPEWLFVAGYYLSARLAIGQILGGAEKEYAVKQVQERLGTAFKHIMDSPWRSLPELTNANGEHCRQSCDAQAWSVGCLIEACSKLKSMSE